MTLFLIKCLSVWFLILVQFSVFSETKPTLDPNASEIYLNELQELQITCTGDRPLIFSYPSESTEYIARSQEIVREYQSGSHHMITFLRKRALHGDTGWYSCAYRDNEEDLTRVYVYVKSTENFFVGNETIIIIQAVENHALELPCRPTSPDYQVQLMRGDDEVIEEGENVIFDKTKGFTIKRVRLTDNGHLKCVIDIDGNLQEKLFLLTVIGSEPTVAEPTIIKDPLRHVTEGQKLRVNCTVEVNKNTPYLLNWTTPRQDNRITSKLYLIDDHGVNSNIQLAVCELQIDGVIEEDAGEYVCTISTFLNSASTSINLKVHDSYSKYINLETERRNYSQHEYESIQWVVYIDAYPQPEIIWLDPHGNKIINSSSALVEDKYIIYNTETTSTLKINKLEVKDKGNYILRAEHPRTRMIETLNFTLDVLAKPVTIISENIHKFYMPGDIAEIYCHAAGNPSPQITWSFRKIDGSSIQILNNTEEHLEETSRNSTVRLTVESTGNITCSASNNLGYDNVERPILMTDVLEGFGVIPPKNEVIVGDKVELICAASVYNYTDEVEWLDSENFAPVTLVPGRIDVKKEKTLFTHRAVLTINMVKKSDGKTYVCSSKSKSEIIEKKDYTLKVYDPQLPFFVETNMNNTKTIFPIGKSNLRSISLTCYAEGMPKPEITWWKDNVRIEINNQSKTDMCEYKSVNSQLLYIDYLYENCSGEYRCKAKNRFGSVEASINMVFEGIVKGHEGSAILKYSLVILVIICIIMAISFSIKMHREKVLRKMLMEAGLTHFEEGALECLNPELSVDHQAELLPYDRRWEFPRDKLKFGKQLGCGAFGVVMKAEAQGICEGEVVTTVAVKMVRRLSESTYIRALVSELKIMVHLGKHLNVVNLLGACTKNIAKRELLVIVEYCRFGNLHNYLLRHRSEFINQIDSSTGKIDISIGSDLLTRSGSNVSSNSHSMGSGDAPDSTGLSSGPDSRGLNSTQEGMVLTSNSTQPGWRSNYRGDYKDQGLKPICTQDLLSWAFQVARGMEYLSQRKVLHGDLAARNILLAEDNVVKICDFGLAKTMYKDDNYKKTGDAPLPIKWMAIESIRDRVFSTQSDIWSYGIVLWEFFTLAETPYPGMEAEKQYLKLIEGYRMEKPEFATQDVYDIMFQCWKAKPILRPTFTELVKSIGDLLDESVKMHYVDLNTPYLDMNTLFHDGGKNDYLTMMSSPDHQALSSPAPGDYVNAPRVSKISNTDDSYLCMSPTSRKSESGIFSPTGKTHFEFPNHETPVQIHSDSDSEPVELSPMLKSEDDNYLKPINVHERRAEFARQREAMKIAEKKKLMERDSGYCNTPHNLVIMDVHGEHPKDEIDFPKLGGKNVEINNSNGYLPGVIRAADNIPKQKNDLRKNLPDSYSNPSYQIMRDEKFEHSNA